MRELGVPQPNINEGSSQFPAMHVPTEAPAAAFGGGPAVAGSFEAGQKLAETVGGIAEKHQAEANQVMHTDLDTQLAGLQSKVQIQAQQMRGKDAMGAQAMAANEWASGVSEIMKQAQPNKEVYRTVNASAASRGMALNDAIHQHATQELFQYENQQTVSGLKASQNLAALNANDTGAVSRELGDGGQVDTLAKQWAIRNGVGQDSTQYKEFVQTQKSSGYKAVIDENVTAGNYKLAEQNFNMIKKDGNVTDEDLKYLNTKMQKAKVDNTVLQVFNDPKYKLMADGNKDGATMVADVDKRTDLNDDQKKEAKSGIYQMVNDQDRMNARRDTANQRGFEDKILTAIKNNPTITVAQLNTMANVGFKDPVDLNTRLNFIANARSPKDSDAGTFNKIYDGLESGHMTKDEIDNAFNNGKINNKDYKTLSDKYVMNITQGKNPATEVALGEITKAATAQISNKKDRDEYMAVVKRAAGGKTPEELHKFAQDEMGTHKEAGRVWGTNNVKNWKADFQKQNAEDTGWGKVHEDVGMTQVNGIIDGLTRTTRSGKAGLSEISNFADQVGGYSQLKEGMPANNAIQSILKRGGVVTPGSIKAALAIQKNGIF